VTAAALPEIVALAALIGVFMYGFAAAQANMVGNQVSGFRSITSSMMSFIENFIGTEGGFSYGDIAENINPTVFPEQLKGYISLVLYFVFAMLFMMMLVNVFVTIMMDRYADIEGEMKENGRHRNARSLLHKWGVALDLKVRRCGTAVTNSVCNGDSDMPSEHSPVFYVKHADLGVDIEANSKGKKFPFVVKWHGSLYDVKWIIPPTEASDDPVKIKSVEPRLNGEVSLNNGAAFYNPQKKTMFDYSE
jgi:hypothetical protein